MHSPLYIPLGAGFVNILVLYDNRTENRGTLCSKPPLCDIRRHHPLWTIDWALRLRRGHVDQPRPLAVDIKRIDGML